MKIKQDSGLIITSLSLMILLSFIGVSILASTIFHIKILGARNRKGGEVSILQSGLINYLHNFREKVYMANLNEYEFIEDDYFNNEGFSNLIKKDYLISNMFKNNIRFQEKYKAIGINNKVIAILKDKKLALESIINIDILSGNIPITAIPLFLNKKSEVSKADFLINNKINLNSTSFITKNDTGVKFDLDNFLVDSLDLNGKVLDWKDIRKRVGEEINDTPLDNGIYSFVNVENEEKLDAIFIQGDVQKIIFSIEDEKQKLLITFEDKDYLLAYKPDKYDLIWKSEFEEPILFNEKLIINGSIFSLISEGNFAFLKNTDLCLYSSGIVNIDSSLNSDSSVGSSLKIITGYNEFFNKPASGGKVIINKDKDNSIIKLSVSIIALDRVVNNNKEVEFNGSVFAESIDNKGIINFVPFNRKNAIDPYFTTEKFTFIKDFIVSLNGEVYYD